MVSEGDLSRRLLKVEPQEIAALVWSCAYFFCLLSGYYVLRSFRDAWGAASGAENLPWLFMATAIAMLAASIAFAAVTTRLPRRRFIPIAYRFFIANLLAFLILFKVLPEGPALWLGRTYFVWVSVYSLFVVSVFWSFMADLFTNPQGRRLFPIIAMGGTLGHICGSFAASKLATSVGGAENLLLITMVLLEAACWCVLRLNAINERGGSIAPSAPAEPAGEQAIGGGALAGLYRVVQSPYLAGIALFVLAYTVSSTILYATKISIAIELEAAQAQRVAFFARIDFWTGVATILAQLFLTTRLIGRFGVGPTLSLLPAVTLIGFGLLGLSLARPEWLPIVAVLTGFEALRRMTNFAMSRPAREILFTVVERRDKYKTKNVIDTFVYRTGDQIGIWCHAGLVFAGLTASAICFVVIPLAAAWLMLGLGLGRAQQRRAESG